MIINGTDLLLAAPIKNMESSKQRYKGVSYGLAEAGFDIRIKQDVLFRHGNIIVDGEMSGKGNFTLASAIEEFQMPEDLVGVVHDKSTWAREGLSVFNTVIEPGFAGGLTLELVFHRTGTLHIPAGAGIAQVLFTKLHSNASYSTLR